MLARGCNISVQGLNEFANVARRKLGMNWSDLREALAAVRALCVVPIDVAIHSEALRVAETYRCAIYDALVVAALRADCGILWSEDMQDGLVVDRRLRIANPFR